MIQILSKNSGMRGMVQGQMLDMHYAKRSTPSPQLEDLSNIHGKKTGALIEAAVLCGLYAARPHPESAHLLAFQNYAQKLGLCFQIQDDIQDVLGNPEMLGKHTGQDKAQGKATFPGQLGVEASFQMLQALQIEMEATINFSSTLEKHLLELFHFFIQGLFGTAASKP